MNNRKKIQVILSVMLLSAALTGCMSGPYKKGMKALEEKQYEEAAKEFQESIDKKDNTADSYRGLGIALWESKDYKGAKRAFEKAVKAGAKKNGTLCNFLGSCELEVGDAKKAIGYYEKGLKDSENSKELKQEMRMNLIIAYEKAGDVEQAKTLLDAYIRDYPDDEAAAKEADFLKTR